MWRQFWMQALMRNQRFFVCGLTKFVVFNLEAYELKDLKGQCKGQCHKRFQVHLQHLTF